MNKCVKKIAVIGGGASGLLFSYLAKFKLGKSAKVTIFEKNAKVGKKILATGNGKCNLSNENLDEGMYNSDFAREIIRLVDTKMVKKVFFKLGIITKTDNEGRIYPYSLSANSVLDALYNANIKLENEIITNHLVSAIDFKNGMYFVDKEPFDYLVMACGGKASTNINHLIGEDLVKFGHKWVLDHPGLCSIKTNEDTSSLNGIKVKANVCVDDKVFKGEVLFKNDGLSGIAIFEASRYLEKGKTVHLDLMSEYNLEKLEELVDNVDTFTYTFPKMVAKDLLARANGDYHLALREAKDYKFGVKELSRYENSQIMVGGISTDDINYDLSSKIMPNLYILGEVSDVDGSTGGYNLHYAWACSILASENIARIINNESSNN